MPSALQGRRLLRFGELQLDLQSAELCRDGVTIRLPDQPFRVLVLLLERSGEVVTREELQNKLWAADTFVDFNIGLNSVIRKLRDALGDSAEHPRFIETLPKRGYRFIAPVTPATPDQRPQPGTRGTAAAGSRVRLAWMAGGLVLATAIGTLALALERGWWGLRAGPAAGHIRSLAVLPFENLTGDHAQDYFVDGMTDALTTSLAQAGGFHVISRTSAMQYRRSKQPLPAMAKALQVDAFLQGAVVISGQHVRITAQLIHAATDRHVWARSYEGEVSGIVALQQEMARAIAAAIGGPRASPPPPRAGAAPTVDPEAYDAYLKGVAAAGRDTYDGFRIAVAYFEAAVARQPEFAMAYAALAQAQTQFLFTGPLSPREAIPKAEAAARKALQLDESLAGAHRTLGNILHFFSWQWEEGDREHARARALGDTSAETRPKAAGGLRRNGLLEEAIAEAERARTLDPLAFNAHMNVGTAYRAAGQYDRAIAAFRRALEVTPGRGRAHFHLGVTLIEMGRSHEAINEFETAVTSGQPRNARFQAYLGYAYAAAGRRLDARRILKELESRARQQYVSSFGIALIHDALGEKEPALAALARAYQDHAVEFAQMAQYPPFRTIASDPRFHETMRLIGLPR